MHSRPVVSAFILTISLGLTGCRQADGPLPVAAGDRPNQITDISRDLLSVSRGDAQAGTDLADDLRVFIDTVPAAVPPSNELARRTSAAVAGKPLTEQNAQRLAHQLWSVGASRELSDRQVESMQNDLQALLVSMGAAEANAQAVAAQAGELQKVVSIRQRRWYEVF